LAGEFESALLAEDAKVEHKTVILEDEAGELEAANEPIRVRMAHVLVAHHYVVLCRHVIGEIVIHDESEEAIE